jgi:hypothetical protein
MIARISGTVILSLIVFVLVALLVTIGVWWWSGGLLPGTMIGVISGFAAAFLVGTVGIAVGRSGVSRANGSATITSDPAADRATEQGGPLVTAGSTPKEDID